ncbi:MAG: hypothetical protein ACREDR_36555, partial [Blastocatellia bacterium]
SRLPPQRSIYRLNAVFRLNDYVTVARAIAEREGLSAEEKDSIGARLVAVHALTIIRHIDLIRQGS